LDFKKRQLCELDRGIQDIAAGRYHVFDSGYKEKHAYIIFVAAMRVCSSNGDEVRRDEQKALFSDFATQIRVDDRYEVPGADVPAPRDRIAYGASFRT
jgi:hypothetical protein